METPVESPSLSILERIANQIGEINSVLSESDQGSAELKLDLENSSDINLMLETILQQAQIICEQCKKALEYTYGGSYRSTYEYYGKLGESLLGLVDLLMPYLGEIMNDTNSETVMKICDLLKYAGTSIARSMQWIYDSGYIE